MSIIQLYLKIPTYINIIIVSLFLTLGARIRFLYLGHENDYTTLPISFI